MIRHLALPRTLPLFIVLLAACGAPPRQEANRPAATTTPALASAQEPPAPPAPPPVPPPHLEQPAIAAANVMLYDMSAPSPPAMALARSIALPAMAMAPGFMPDNTERYAHAEQNPVHVANRNPVSTFSLDVDTASYANVRRFLRHGELPPEDAVRVEELVNYFPYDYPVAAGSHPFGVGTEVARAPWNPEHLLIRVGVKAQEPRAAKAGAAASLPPDSLPPANLVFLVDVSGSMDEPDKLPLVQASLRMLVKQLRPEDRVSLVVYAGRTAVELPATPGNRHHKILAAIQRLTAEGSTNGSAALELAYEQARAGFIPGGINRILMATDGDFNVGVTDQAALEARIRRERDSGISLSLLGFGTGNLNDALMEQLADQGNGNYSYVDSVDEARKVLVNELAATLHTVAKDVKVQVEFNPARVAEYRLIGYENRVLREEDFRNDRVDAGEVGAGHSVTALYEVTPVGAATLHGERRYAPVTTPVPSGLHADELAEVRVRYQPVTSSRNASPAVVEFAQAVVVPTGSTGGAIGNGSDDLRFAAAVAGFGELLRGGRYQGHWVQADVLRLARGALGRDAGGWRAEFVRLVQVADSLDHRRPDTGASGAATDDTANGAE